MLSLLKRVFEANFLFSNVLVPLIGLIGYCASFAYLAARFELQGVNYFFANRLGRYALFALAGVLLAFLVVLKVNPGGGLGFKRSRARPAPADLILLLLPLTPVTQYILSNLETMSFTDAAYALVILAGVSGIYIFALPQLLGTFIPGRPLMIVGLAFMFTIASMASLSSQFTWFEKGSLKIQLVVMGSVFLAVWLLDHPGKRRILYILVAVNLAANLSARLLSADNQAEARPASTQENRLQSLVRPRTPASTPSIYLLVYDAYVPNETMRSYGIDNSAQEEYLNGLGFELYPHVYSIGSTSISTMSRVLNASTEYYGDTRRAVSGDGITHQILKDLGYETYGLFFSDYMFSGVGENYDHSIPERTTPAYVQLMKAVLIGEFRFDIMAIGFGAQTRDQFIEAKHDIFSQPPRNRIFVYMHTDLPNHSQNSGACLSNEIDLFRERLARANHEMQQDVNLIVGHDPGAIVIVAGDHGPYLTKNCFITTGVYDTAEISRLDIQDRHGSFLAIRWPGGDFEKYDDITVLQDLFPAVFAYLYRDPAILEAKVEPALVMPSVISGVTVDAGVIRGGIHDGQPLFLAGE